MLDSLIEQAPVGFAFIGADLRLQRVSSSLAEMTGGTEAGQVGRTIGEIWPPAVAAATESAVSSVLATGLPVVNQVTSAACAVMSRTSAMGSSRWRRTAFLDRDRVLPAMRSPPMAPSRANRLSNSGGVGWPCPGIRRATRPTPPLGSP